MSEGTVAARVAGSEQAIVPVRNQSEVAEAARQAAEAAERHGFGAADAGRVGLVAAELAANLVSHAPGGEILVGAFDDEEGSGIQLLALDRGAGMTDAAARMADSYSGRGTPGLSAIIRQSQLVDIASWPGGGTVVLARLAAGQPGGGRPPIRASAGAVQVRQPGEQVCGDGWSVSNGGNGRTLMVADGLGHGPAAAEAAVEAVRLFHRFNGHAVPTLLDYMNGGLRATRGAAVAIARLDPAAPRIVFSGIGNIAGVVFAGDEVRRMVSLPGTAGHNARKIQAFHYPFEGGLVILHSDGLLSTWTLDRYPNLDTLHPALIAGVLYRDLARRRDDTTVLVAKW